MSSNKKKKITIEDDWDEQEADAPRSEEAKESPEQPPAADATADEVARLSREVEEWKDKFLRAKAEQQNLLRRVANEREEAILYGNADLLRSLLEVADDFDRTIEAAESAGVENSLLDGVKIVRNKLEKLLVDNSVQAIGAQNEPFDPNRHQALMSQPSAEHEPGTVLQEVQKGYTHRDRVLRPAKVIVSTAPEEGGRTEEESD